MTPSGIVAIITGNCEKHQDAAEILQENFEARMALLYPDHIDTLLYAVTLCSQLWQPGKLTEAEDLVRRTLATFEPILGALSTGKLKTDTVSS